MAALAEHTRIKYGTCGDIEAGLLETERFTDVQKAPSRTVYLRNNYYIKTNFYIEQSRQYVGDHKLTCYFYLPFSEWFFLVIVLASISAPAHGAPAFIFFIIAVIFLVVFLQHLYVNLRTIPHILQQPSTEDRYQQTGNAHYEITVEKYKFLFAASSDAGIGAFAAGRENSKVKIQVFTETAIGVIKRCQALSYVGFFVTLLMIVYCFAWGIVRVLDPL